MTIEAAKGAGGALPSSSPAKTTTTTMITPAEPAGHAEPGTPTRARAKPVTPRPSRVYAVELPSFEGPLDLLLHLVRRHELDILDIPIAFVTEKYLEYLSLMRALDIEILGDYLVMAATLAYLKSRELVPQQSSEEEGGDEDEEDGEDPREALIRRLIEYERFRAAGRELNEMPVIGRDVFARGGNIDLPPLDPGMAPVTLFRLTEAYARVLQRAQINKSHEVQLERVTVRQRMEQLSLLLDERESVDFESLFLEQVWGSVEELRQMLVVTLMSVLELVKLGIIGVRQTHDTESIHLQKRASHAEAMKALTSYSEDDSFGEGGGAAGGGQPVTPTVADPAVGESSAAVADPAAGEPSSAALGSASSGTEAAEAGATSVRSGVAELRADERVVPGLGATSPGAASPGVASPGVASPEVASPGVASPEAASPEAASPEAASPEAASPEAASPGVASPEAVSPGAASPGVASSEAASPGATSPGVASSETASPGVASLEAASPETASPGVAWPEAASPEAASPGVAWPGVASSEAASSEAASPGVASPGAAAPGEAAASSGAAEPSADEGGAPDHGGASSGAVSPGVAEPGEAALGAVSASPAQMPVREVAGGRDRDFSGDALGAMLASVRRLEAEEERGVAAVSPPSGADVVSESLPADSSPDAESERPSGVPVAADGEDDERGEPALGSGLAGSSKQPRAELEAPQEDLDVNRGGIEPSFIDAMDDSGESHE